jgi:hypothetical protein
MFSEGATRDVPPVRLKKIEIDWGRRTYKIKANYECYMSIESKIKPSLFELLLSRYVLELLRIIVKL